MLRLDAETLTTLGATSTDNGASTAGRHADQEAMRALATDDGGLIGALHNDNLLLCKVKRAQLDPD